jgi:hypothetical protein
MKRKSNPKSAKPTQRSLADLLGVSRQLLASHMKKPGAPALDDLAGWQVFLAQVGRIGSAPPELRRAIAQERLEILKATRRKLDRENAIADKELISVSEVVAQCNAAGALFMDSLEKLCREAPPLLAGCNVQDVSSRIEHEVESIRKHLTQKMQEIGK